jgi:hypothetical protein
LDKPEKANHQDEETADFNDAQNFDLHLRNPFIIKRSDYQNTMRLTACGPAAWPNVQDWVKLNYSSIEAHTIENSTRRQGRLQRRVGRNFSIAGFHHSSEAYGEQNGRSWEDKRPERQTGQNSHGCYFQRVCQDAGNAKYTIGDE